MTSTEPGDATSSSPYKKERHLTDPVVAGIFLLVGAVLAGVFALAGGVVQSHLSADSTAKENASNFLRQQRTSAYSTLLTDASVYLNDMGPLLQHSASDREVIYDNELTKLESDGNIVTLVGKPQTVATTVALLHLASNMMGDSYTTAQSAQATVGQYATLETDLVVDMQNDVQR